jgi:tape measure domain-containing protein
MNDGLQTTAELQDMIYQAAQRSRGSYQVAADAVSKMGLMAGDAFNSTAEIVAFVEQLNKQFALAGTEQVGIAAATTQLTQALASGVLRGDELNSIFEQAPTIIQTIADYLNVPIGQIRSMAAEGLITASAVKNAMLSAAAETNARFESMPWTWGQVGIKVMNQLLKASQPLLNLINKIANNWERLEPIIMGVVAVVGVYLGYMAALKIAELARNVVLGIQAVLTYAAAAADVAKGASMQMDAMATAEATAAQYGFNAALLACPITWIVVAIIAAITAITALVRHFDIFGAKSTSVMGTVVGLIYVAGAAIQNFGRLVQLIAMMIHSAITALCNNIRAAFSMAINGVIGFFYNLLSVAMSVIASIANALNALPFVSIDVSGLSAAAGNYAQKSADAYAKANDSKAVLKGGFNKQMKAEMQAQYQKNKSTTYFKDYTSAFQTGAAKVGGLTGGGYDMNTLGGAVEDIAANTGGTPGGGSPAGQTAGNTGKMADAMDVMEDILEYMVDIAERETVNRFTTAEINIDQTNNNSIASGLDLDGIMEQWNDDFTEILQVAAEGVHV